MKKILLVLTGGTIGSSVTDSTIHTNASTGHYLMELLKAGYPHFKAFEFQIIQPVELLSENLAPGIWEQIIGAVEARRPTEFDGVIITHGTDTLAFTAAALALFWHALPRPVLLVSSDYPLTDSRANGIANFICALEFIRKLQETGVFVPYQNQRQGMQVHLGTRLASSLPLSSDFFSVRNDPYLTFNGNDFIPPHPREAGPEKRTYPLKANFNKRILMIRPYPGLDYDCFDLTGIDAVLHDLYHSGTASVADNGGGQHSLATFIERCGQQKIPVYLAPAIKNLACYESTKILLDRGARMIWNTPLESAYVKLLLAYSNFNDTQMLLDFLDSDIANEHVSTND